jgi:hypothetical protein
MDRAVRDVDATQMLPTTTATVPPTICRMFRAIKDCRREAPNRLAGRLAGGRLRTENRNGTEDRRMLPRIASERTAILVDHGRRAKHR